MSNLWSLFLFTTLLIFAAACTKNAIPASEKKYEEEMSSFRPRYEYKNEAVASTEVKDNTAVKINTPVSDNTKPLDEKLALISEKNKTIKYTQGYRILLYSGNEKDIAERARATVLEVYPDSRPEVKYIQPNFKVKVGEFYDRIEAQLMLIRLKEFFPSALVVQEKINIK